MREIYNVIAYFLFSLIMYFIIGIFIVNISFLLLLLLMIVAFPIYTAVQTIILIILLKLKN